MSSLLDADDVDGSAEQLLELVSDPETKRDLLNPFETGDWITYANELTRNYMAEEMEDDQYYLLGDHHERWLEGFDGGDRVLLCHRDGLKTTITLAYLIASLEYKDGFRAVWAMNNQGSVKKKADTEFWKFVERNEWLTNLNGPRKKDTIEAKVGPRFDAQRRLALRRDRGRSRPPTRSGRHHQGEGDGDTEDVLDWIQAVSVPMVKEGGRTVMIGTGSDRPISTTTIGRSRATSSTSIPRSSTSGISSSAPTTIGRIAGLIPSSTPRSLIRGTKARHSRYSGPRLEAHSGSRTNGRRWPTTASGESTASSSWARAGT